jgi:hypothetical protein
MDLKDLQRFKVLKDMQEHTAWKEDSKSLHPTEYDDVDFVHSRGSSNSVHLTLPPPLSTEERVDIFRCFKRCFTFNSM